MLHPLWKNYFATAAYTELKANVVIAPLSSRPREKSVAVPALLTWIIISKYEDHLPLNRMMQVLKSSGYAQPYATITDWVAATSRLIVQLYEALQKEILSTGYIHADETTNSFENAERFYDSLNISRRNTLTIEDAIYQAY